MNEPIKPDLGDCCAGGSCCPCVWDYYYSELKKFNEWKEIQAKNSTL